MENYTDLIFSDEGGVATIVIDRPENGNMIRRQTAIELADALRSFRDDPKLRVAVLTGAGDRFFCIGGEHDEFDGFDHSVVLPLVDVYELMDTIAKPIIAAVNGFAVGGGNVLQVVCDVAIAADNAVFRQVGPSVGSFDAGYGTWILEQQIGRRRAKEMWFFNRRYDAAEALAMGLVNAVVPAAVLMSTANEWAGELLDRGPGALAGLKTAFSARHAGVAGQARLAHDLLLTHYLRTEEAHEMSESFRERRPPNRDRFNK